MILGSFLEVYRSFWKARNMSDQDVKIVSRIENEEFNFVILKFGKGIYKLSECDNEFDLFRLNRIDEKFNWSNSPLLTFSKDKMDDAIEFVKTFILEIEN